MPRNVGSLWRTAGSDAMRRSEVFGFIVAVSIVFRLICPVRFCNCCGGAEVDCGCDRLRGVFTEEVGFPGAGRVVVMLSPVSYFLWGAVGRKPDCCFVNR